MARRQRRAEMYPLQLCRPLSGAVIDGGAYYAGYAQAGLQLCRPLSGAVIPRRLCYNDGIGCASIVPPPFGSGYQRRKAQCSLRFGASIVPPPFGSGYTLRGSGGGWGKAASIVPPPFGSGYADTLVVNDRNLGVLQLCRPLSGAVIIRASVAAIPALDASIVPPPFGSGYRKAGVCIGCGAKASIVPPPFGSGYEFAAVQRVLI